MDFRPFRDSEVVHGHQINVCVRKRPMNKKECDLREIDIVTIPNREQLIVHEPKLKVRLWLFSKRMHDILETHNDLQFCAKNFKNLDF